MLVTFGLDQEMNRQSSRQGEYLECDLLLQVRRSRAAVVDPSPKDVGQPNIMDVTPWLRSTGAS